MTRQVLKLMVVAGIVLLCAASTGLAGDSKFVLGGYFDANYTYYEQSGKPGTFDMYHFNPIFLYQIEDNILFSAELEFEHGGDEIAVEYAQIDYLWNDYVTVTAGKFLVPFGAFNRRLHPGWISKVPWKPLSNNQVVPTGWSESGVMFSGAVGFGENGGRVNYAAYLASGLEGDDGDKIRSLRKTDPRDKNNNNSAIGGRLGVVPMPGVEAGASFYTCDYSTDPMAPLDITFIGFDAEFHHEDWFELRGEYNQAKQDFTDPGYDSTDAGGTDWFTPFASDVTKKGYYVQASVMLSILDQDILMPMEVAVRYSTQDFGTDATKISELSPTLNYYLSSTTIVRLSYTIMGETGADNKVDNNLITLVITKGF